MRLASIYHYVCCVFMALPMLAAPALTLPPVVHFDMETSTNVTFAVGASGAGRFTLSLECLATPSNNVEAAFGRGLDSHGESFDARTTADAIAIRFR